MTNKKITVKVARIIREIYGCSLGQSKKAAKRFLRNEYLVYQRVWGEAFFCFDYTWFDDNSGEFISPGKHMSNVPFPEELVTLKKAFKKYPGNALKNELRNRNKPLDYDKCIHINNKGNSSLVTAANPDIVFCTLCTAQFLRKC